MNYTYNQPPLLRVGVNLWRSQVVESRSHVHTMQ